MGQPQLGDLVKIHLQPFFFCMPYNPDLQLVHDPNLQLVHDPDLQLVHDPTQRTLPKGHVLLLS